MASETERARVAGTHNVYDFEKFKVLKLVEKYRDAYPDIADVFVFGDQLEALAKDFDAINPEPTTNYLLHHARMIKAASKIKARRDFIDEQV